MESDFNGIPEQPMPNDGMGGTDAMPPTDDMENSMPMGDGMNAPQQGESQYDTNFDAGVEADEDTDPKKYIQQLTGKLSTTLNNYNSENADDDGLNKYVAKMIVKASTKNMDETNKKEIIKAINTSQNDTPEDDTEDLNSEESMDEPMDNDQKPVDDMGGEMPIQEEVFTKKQLMEMVKHHK